MLNIFSQKLETFGLDISDLSLKIAKLEKKGEGLELAFFGTWTIPSGIIEGGEIRDKKTLSEIIKKALEVQKKKIKLGSVICSLPEEKSFLDVIRLPQIKKEELRTTVEYEVENYIPLPVNQVYFDCEIIKPVRVVGGRRPKYIEVLIVATPKKIVDSYLEVLKMGGLKPRALEVECLAIARALVREAKSSRPLLLIDFGETRTTLIIFSGESLRFTSTIPVSSQKLTESISRTLKINLKKAEELKLKEGLEGKEEVFEAMVPPLTDLVEQIETHLEYWRSHEKGDRIARDGKELEKILLCGGGSLLKGLVGFLAKSLKVEVELANPWVNILKTPLKEVPELSFKQSLGYTTALGLALKSFVQNLES